MNPLDRPEWRSFVEAIRLAPADLTTRLVAADWLDDQDRPEFAAWAQFVRLQCAATAHRATTAFLSHPTANWCDCEGCRADRAAAELWERWSTAWGGAIAPDTLITVWADATLWRDGFPVALRVRPDRLRAVSVYHLAGEDIRVTSSLIEQFAFHLAGRVPLDALVFDVFAERQWVAAVYRPDANPRLGSYHSYHFGHSHNDGRTPATVVPAHMGDAAGPCRPSILADTARLITEIFHASIRRNPESERRPRRSDNYLPGPARILEWLAPTRDLKAGAELRTVMR